MIRGLNEQLYLEINQDIKDAIIKGDFRDVSEHMKKVGLNELEKGLRKFHKEFEPYNEEVYLESFPDIKEAVANEVLESGFEHFCAFGYKDIITGCREWTKATEENEPVDTEEVTGFIEALKTEQLISNFDDEMYLRANPDVEAAINNGELKSAYEYLEIAGLEEIEKGLHPFHKEFEPYNEDKYLKLNPDVTEAVIDGDFKSGFEHFCMFGYKDIITGCREWIQVSKIAESSEKTVIAVLGIPRSGLTLLTALLGSNSQTSAWFLPYSTRKNLGIELFTDFKSIESQYKKAFPESISLNDTIVISESTADTESIEFIINSFKNLSENGVKTKFIWLVRDINHCYLSQNEAAHKYWGDTSDPLTEESYLQYLRFARDGYKQLVQLMSGEEHMIVSYHNLISEPELITQKLTNFFNLTLEQKQFSYETFSQLKVAGDPGFFNHKDINVESEKRRSSFWDSQQKNYTGVDDKLTLFMQEYNKLVHSIHPETIYTLVYYEKTLLDTCFDVDYYLSNNTDIYTAKIDPLKHYISNGWKEDRNPNETFNTRLYKEEIHDGSLFNPLSHYCLIGRYEADLEEFSPDDVMTNLVLIDPEKYTITDTLLLEAPFYENPEVSIIVPAYNQEKYTLACVESIIKNTDNVTYEIIIMDDKSPHQSAREIYKYMKNIIFYSNEENLGFLRNCNKGATVSNGKYLLFLNNDTNVQPGWLSSLVELIGSSKEIGMVGSRLVYPNGQQQEAGGIVWNDASGWNFGRLDNPQKPEYNYVKEADYLTGAAMMILKSLWDEIGGFDERYVPAYYEDTDLAFEVRKHGHKTLFQPKSVVIHFEGISNGTDLGSGIKQYQVVNKEKFFDKWKKELTQNQFPNAQDIFLARDCSAKKKHLLFVDHYLPHYDQDAGSKATFQYLQILVKNNIQVHFIGDNFSKYPGTPYLEALTQMGIEVLCGEWYQKNWKTWFQEHGKYFDYAVLSRPHIAEKYIDVIKEKSDAKIIYFGHDLHFLRERREYEIKGDDIYLDNSLSWLNTELSLIRKSDVSFFFSDVEKHEIKKIHPYASVDVVPLYIYDTFKKRKVKSKKRQDIMFVGGFAHAPNIDAVIWFVQNIWPSIEKKVPGIKFYIIGSKPTEEVLALRSDSVVVTGYIEDEILDDYYDQCKVAVAPLRYGAGIKGKVVDALYNGMPIVTTSIGAEGLDDAQSVMLVDDDPKMFAKSVLRLYMDDDLADKYAKKAIKYCKKYFSEERAKIKMSHIFTEFKERK